MPKLLYISVSPQGDNSRSRALGTEFLSNFKESHADGEVIERDLNSNPVPHLDGEALTAGYLPEDKRSPGMTEKHNLRVTLINEIIGADEIVVSTPMWNWNTPSVLKAYIDQIVVVGMLDPYSHKHLAGKRVTVLIACGGAYGTGRCS
jgi:FMN-dependent NADH-azoreductase